MYFEKKRILRTVTGFHVITVIREACSLCHHEDSSNTNTQLSVAESSLSSCVHSSLDFVQCVCLSIFVLFVFFVFSRLRNDRQRDGRPHSHDDVHHVGGGLALPGLHPLLCPKGPVRHLRHHIRAELHPFCSQLQATGLLERGLEAAAAGQAGLSCSERQ